MFIVTEYAALSFSKFKAQPFGLEQRADLKSLDSVKTLY